MHFFLVYNNFPTLYLCLYAFLLFVCVCVALDIFSVLNSLYFSVLLARKRRSRKLGENIPHTEARNPSVPPNSSLPNNYITRRKDCGKGISKIRFLVS